MVKPELGRKGAEIFITGRSSARAIVAAAASGDTMPYRFMLPGDNPPRTPAVPAS